jgi:uncharacterized protein YbcV (DUF1398 family)
MTFTIANQQDNKITNTTTQTIKHVMYSNNEVTISGMNNLHSVWHKQGRRMSQKIDGLNLAEAVDFANNLIKNI